MFTQSLLETEKILLDFLNYLFQSRLSLSQDLVDKKEFDLYIGKFDYSILLDNLKQRADCKLTKCYINRVIQGYYSIFLANINEEISEDLQFISKRFLKWEK